MARESRRERERQRWMPIVGVGYYFFLPTADARHSSFNRAHFKTQHSCLLCIWAPDRKRREERREAEENKGKRRGRRMREREQETDRVGRNRGKMREEEGGERGKKQRLTQITSISTAQTWAGFTIINREIPTSPSHFIPSLAFPSKSWEPLTGPIHNRD